MAGSALCCKSPEPVPDERWHAPQKAARDAPRRTPAATKSDWNPLGEIAQEYKRGLEGWGITHDLDLALLWKRADGDHAAARTKSTFSWQSVGDWELWKTDAGATTYLSWVLYGAEGLGYDTSKKTLSSQVGALSDLNADVYPDPVIVNDLSVEFVSAGGDVLLNAGKVDLSYRFDTNRVANDGFGQFQAFSLVNNPSIPFPDYGGFGAWARVDFGTGYAMLGVADSASDRAVAPWKTLDENSRYQLGELGIHVDTEALGKGTIRLSPWHNHLSGEDGWGLGLNVDQDLGREDVVGFLRAGYGDGDVTPVERFLSGGFSVRGLFDRPEDTLGLGASWSDPSSGNGVRSETLVETYYAIRLSPSVVLTPDLQLVLHPAQKRRDSQVVVGGLRLVVQL